MKNERKVKVFQVRKNIFDKNGDLIPRIKRKTEVVCIGTVLLPRKEKPMDEESIWDLFNWTCWWHDVKRDVWLHGIRNGFRKDGYRCFPNTNARGYCNSDIFFKMKGKWYVALSCGWDKTCSSFEDAVALSKKRIEF